MDTLVKNASETKNRELAGTKERTTRKKWNASKIAAIVTGLAIVGFTFADALNGHGQKDNPNLNPLAVGSGSGSGSGGSGNEGDDNNTNKGQSTERTETTTVETFTTTSPGWSWSASANVWLLGGNATQNWPPSYTKTTTTVTDKYNCCKPEGENECNDMICP